MRKRTMAILAASLAAGSLLAACGGDDDDDGNGGEALSKAEYIRQGDAICAEGDREIEQAAEEQFGGSEDQPTEEEIGEFAQEEVLPNLQDQIDRLRELPAPEGDEEEVEAIYDAADEGIQQLEEAGPEGFVEQGDEAFEEANRLAGEYGFQNCGGQGDDEEQ